MSADTEGSENLPSHSALLLERTLDRIDTYVALANVKASLLLPLNVLALGFLVSDVPDVAPSGVGLAMAGVRTAQTVAAGALAVSCLYCLRVVFSFLKTGSRPGAYHSLLFFGSIREMQKSDYLARIGQLTTQELRDDLAEQVYLLSALHEKFGEMNRAILWTGVGLLVLFVIHVFTVWA